MNWSLIPHLFVIPVHRYHFLFTRFTHSTTRCSEAGNREWPCPHLTNSHGHGEIERREESSELSLRFAITYRVRTGTGQGMTVREERVRPETVSRWERKGRRDRLVRSYGCSIPPSPIPSLSLLSVHSSHPDRREREGDREERKGKRKGCHWRLHGKEKDAANEGKGSDCRINQYIGYR